MAEVPGRSFPSVHHLWSMHVGQRYTLKEFIVWMRRDSYWVLSVVGIPTVSHAVLGWSWLSLPWVPIALIGTAAAFVVGFRNNATYARAWESRQIYGAIVNASRSWGLLVMDFVRAGGQMGTEEAAAMRTRLIHRHIAWLTALRYQLRQPRNWESIHLKANREYQRTYFKVPEEQRTLDDCLTPLVRAEDKDHVLSCANRATQLLSLQGRDITTLYEKGVLEPNHRVAMEELLIGLFGEQGKAERIKNYPYPRQFASINRFFVHLFIILLPFGLLGEFAKLGTWQVWLTIPSGFLIGWVFAAMERVGEATENPFEGNANDTPITTLSRTIEIDLREMLGETDIPKPIPAENNIQL